ncbi:MMPL family transporter [Candidatus Marinimicrobia bacterium]|nr:MMPL family transporter [Candidatus Neomarinimicrobiota bacterium]
MLTKIKNYLIDQSIDYSLRTLIISLFLTLIIFAGFRNFKVDDDLIKTFPQDMPSKVIWDNIQEEFGQTEYVFVAFGKKNNNILNDKWAIAQNKIFTDAILNEVPQVDKVISLSTFNKIDGNNDYLEIGLLQREDFIDNFADENYVEETLQDINAYFEKNSEQKKRLVSQNNDYLNIAIRPINDINMSEVVPLIKDLAYKHLGDYEIYFAGQPYLAGETPSLIKKDVSILMGLGILIMILILFVNLRSLYAVFIIILTIVCSFLAMLGYMGWMRLLTGSNYFDFTMMNTSMPIILLTIANSDGVHIVSRFFRELRTIQNQTKAVRLTMESLMQPIFLTSLTTSAAFITMISSPLEYMIGYSFGIAFGVMWALFLSCTMLPSLISLKKWSLDSRAISKESMLERVTSYLGNLVVSHPQKVLSGGLLIVFISMTGIWLINVEVNVIKFYKKGNPIRESTIFVDENFTGTMNLSIELETSITDYDGIPNYDNYLKVYHLQEFLEKNDQINMTFSFVDVLGQTYKAFMNTDSEFIPNEDLLEGVYTFLSSSGGKKNIDDDLIVLLGKDYDEEFMDLDQLLVTAMIKTISTSEIQNLIRETEAYIEENFNKDNSELKISGLSVFINDFVDIIVKSSLTSIMLSILLILIITGLFFRSIKWGLLSIVPLTSAVILNFGLMGIFGIDLNHMTALLSSVIIGVGVDFSIHYISDYRRNLVNKVDFNKINFKTSQDVGYPILLDVASNMGFVALFFSILIPLNHMGGLMVFAMISTSFGTLTILASLIQILQIKKV